MEKLTKELSQETVMIPITGFIEALNAGIDMNLVMILIMVDKDIDISDYLSDSKTKAYVEAIKRKGFIVYNDKSGLDEISPLGRSILAAVKSGNSCKSLLKREKKAKEDSFDLFWKAYPATDKIDYYGFTSPTTRNLRGSKEKTRELFNKIIAEGEYSAQDLIDAIEYQVLLKKKESFRTRKNELKYIQGSETWLRQRTFEAFIEDARKSKQEDTSEGTVSGVVDI